jgi:hypothetical protein
MNQQNQQNQQQYSASEYENKEIEAFIESGYINIRDGESKILEFLKNREKIVDKTDFNGKPTKKMQFMVVNPEDPERKEKKFELSRKHVPWIYNELKKGYTVLEVFRTGTARDTIHTKRNTLEYIFTTVVSPIFFLLSFTFDLDGCRLHIPMQVFVPKPIEVFLS